VLWIAQAYDAAMTLEWPLRRITAPQIVSRPEDSMPALSPYLLPIVLLVGSNVFMTTA
jgi:hypothetical protein